MSKFLITGVNGCIGAWVTRRLIEQGHEVVGTDVSTQGHRLDLLARGLPGFSDLYRGRRLDIADTEAVKATIAEEKPLAVIHLAALQLPICKANPVLCADVNIRGVMNLLEAARATEFRYIYASTTAVYGPSLGRPVGEHENLASLSLYGVFKRANEEMARIYWNDYGIASVGLRPWIVYGAARDQGISADITIALLKAAQGEPYHIRFSGGIALNYTAEIADAFIAAALKPRTGQHVHTMGGPVHEVEDCVAKIEAVTGTTGLVTVDPKPLGIACETTDASFQAEYGPFPYRPIEDGLRETLAIWRSAGMVD